MAKKNKYSKVKPKVNAITLIIIGLVFIGLGLTIVFSIDTPSERFKKIFNDEEGLYEISNFKKVSKKVTDEESLVVVFNVGSSGEQQTSPAPVIKELMEVAKGNELYANYKFNDKVSKVYYVEPKEKETEALAEFFKEFEVKNISTNPVVLYFEKGELKAQYIAKEYSEIINEDKEKATLILNIRNFLEAMDKEKK
jgi:hypothetical protein